MLLNPAGSLSTIVEEPSQELTLEVSIKIFVCHVQVIMY